MQSTNKNITRHIPGQMHMAYIGRNKVVYNSQWSAVNETKSLIKMIPNFLLSPPPSIINFPFKFYFKITVGSAIISAS